MITFLRHRVRKHTISIYHALQGIAWAFKTQPNYLIHILASATALFLGLKLNISSTEWAIIIFVIFVGLAIETINTAIEQTLDCVSLKIREDIKIAKDLGAGAMLLFTCGAISVAIIIFAPKIVLLFNL